MSAEPEPTSERPGRVSAIDLGRGGSVVVMVMVHTLWMYGDLATQRASALGYALHLLGKGTASFLVAMGFSFMLSRSHSVRAAQRRGLTLLALGYAMNLLKFVVPSLLGLTPDAFIEAYGFTPPASAAELLYMAKTGDILQLAGLCLLIMGPLRAKLAAHGDRPGGLLQRRESLLVWAALVAAAPHLVRGVRAGVPGLDYVLDLLWGGEYDVYFPLFPWFAAVLVGMYFGALYLELDRDADALFGRMLITGLPLSALGLGLVLLWPKAQFNDFFHTGFGGMSYLVGLNLVGLWAVHKLAPRLDATRFGALLHYASRRVTSLYVIQWVVICWGMGVVGYQTLGVGGVVAAIPVTMAASFGLRLGLDRLAPRLKSRRRPGR